MMYNLVHENHDRLAVLETDLKNQVIATAKAQARMLEMQEQLAKAHADMSAHMELLHNEMVKWRADIHTSLEASSSDS